MIDYDLKIGIDTNNFEQVREVGDIKWLTYDQICLILRQNNTEKLAMIADINDFAEEYFLTEQDSR